MASHHCDQWLSSWKAGMKTRCQVARGLTWRDQSDQACRTYSSLPLFGPCGSPPHPVRSSPSAASTRSLPYPNRARQSAIDRALPLVIRGFWTPLTLVHNSAGQVIDQGDTTIRGSKPQRPQIRGDSSAEAEVGTDCDARSGRKSELLRGRISSRARAGGIVCESASG